MTDLITWLRAQLDSDERMAHEATGVIAMFTAPRQNGKTVAAMFLRSQTPERLLRQVQAHRAILDRLTETSGAVEAWNEADLDPYVIGARKRELEVVAQILASIYSDRDGYDPDWSA